jgi:hypothetical protein
MNEPIVCVLYQSFDYCNWQIISTNQIEIEIEWADFYPVASIVELLNENNCIETWWSRLDWL